MVVAILTVLFELQRDSHCRFDSAHGGDCQFTQWRIHCQQLLDGGDLIALGPGFLVESPFAHLQCGPHREPFVLHAGDGDDADIQSKTVQYIAGEELLPGAPCRA